jgi:thioredoxin 1
MTIDVTDATFEDMVIKSDKPVIVDFWAKWCGPCRMLMPILKDISEDFEGRAIVVKIDSDSNERTISQYGIRNIPAMLFFNNGKVIYKQIGLVPKNTIVSKLETILKTS